MTALLCSYIFKKYGVEVLLVCPESVEDGLLDGCLQYIYRTKAMATIFEELGLVYSDFAVKGGVLLRGKVEKYPEFFKKRSRKKEVARIKYDYYKKTRLVEAAGSEKKVVPDLSEKKRPRRAIRTDFKWLASELISRAEMVKAKVIFVHENSVLTTAGRFEFDSLVLTAPLWEFRGCVDWYVPHGIAMKLNVVSVAVKKESYAKWDYVLTPYTPADHVHRFFSNGFEYVAEVNGALDEDRLRSDLNFLFKEGWYVKKISEGLSGYLLPLDSEPQWPRNIAPLGRFAKWDHDATLDVVLNEIIYLARRWF